MFYRSINLVIDSLNRLLKSKQIAFHPVHKYTGSGENNKLIISIYRRNTIHFKSHVHKKIDKDKNYFPFLHKHNLHIRITMIVYR